MSDEIKIRFADNNDAKFLVQNVSVPENILRRKIDWQEFIIAECSDSWVGFIELEYLWSVVPFIALIKVVPKHRKQGIGKKLLEFVEEYLLSEGYEKLYSSSQEDEQAPQAWHKHIGFEECGKIEGINNGVDEVFFCKTLNEN